MKENKAKEFSEFIKYIYGDICDIDYQNENEAKFTMNVPGKLKREEFENDVQEWCDEHKCSFELVNQAPEAPSPQYFSENMKLMYPRVKDFETLAKTPRKLEAAKKIFKEQWEQEFDPESEDDKEDIVLLWNEYMDELSEWKPVELKLHFEEDTEEVEDAVECEDRIECEDFALEEIREGDKVKTKRGYIGKVLSIKEFAALLDLGLGHPVREPLKNLTKVEE